MKKNVVVDTNSVTLWVGSIKPLGQALLTGQGQPIMIDMGKSGNAFLSDKAHRQIAQRLSIPWKYYERMLTSNPLLLTESVSSWWRLRPEHRLVVLEEAFGEHSWPVVTEWLKPPAIILP